jgi:predicted TIM-barrel fold metal-dependent hydrolase
MAAAGLRGVQCPRPAPGGPPLSDSSYEPIWRACVELAMPVHVHIGWGGTNVDGLLPSAQRDPAVAAVVRSEIRWLSRRPLWLLIWGGVLERHKELEVVFVEQYADWVPSTLAALDAQYDDYQRGHTIRDALPRRPSEYWHDNCFVCASSISRGEIEMREEIGVSTMLFGTDYPHYEGTWPNTQAWIAQAFAGVGEHDLRAIAGENAIRCYGLDRAELAARAAVVGPTLEDLTRPNDGETAEWLAGRGIGRPVTRV